MAYIDGVLCPVPTANKQTYLAFSEKTAEMFKKYGALSVTENWGDDVPEGKVNSLRTAVMLKDNETVVLSWIIWPSKAARDEAWQKVMGDPDMTNAEMPYDGSRMIFGGFEQILNA